MISLSVHGINAIYSTIHEKEDSYWVDLEFHTGRVGHIQEITLFFNSKDLAQRFHESVHHLYEQGLAETVE